jgi:hypothetical protein
LYWLHFYWLALAQQETNTMKKPSVLATILLLAVALTAIVSADGPVAYTFTFTDLGTPGSHGGGPLYADGTAGGSWTLSANHGQNIIRFSAVSWSYLVPGQSVNICIETSAIKGPLITLPYHCLGDLGVPLPVSGTPVIINNPFGGSALVRVTAVH